MKKILFYILVLAALAACKDETALAEVEKDMRLIEKPQLAVETPMQEQTAEVSITVPDSLWSVSIVRVVQGNDQIAIVAQLTKSDGMGMMVISQVSDAVSFSAKELPIKYYVLGKAWNWENSEDYEFVSTLNLTGGEDMAFTRIKPSHPDGPKKHELM